MCSLTNKHHSSSIQAQMNGRFRVALSIAQQIDQICESDVSVFHEFVTSYRAVNKTLGGGVKGVEFKSAVVK